MPWKLMNLESKNNLEEYGKHYHKRSNVLELPKQVDGHDFHLHLLFQK